MFNFQTMRPKLTPEERKERIEKALDLINEGYPPKSAAEKSGMTLSSFLYYVLQDPIHSNSYRRAQIARSELMVNEIVDIADNDIDPQRARNRIDVRKWIASKVQPKIYGDQIDINLNQTIDIGAALSEGMKRLKSANKLNNEERQAIDLTKTLQHGASGLEPDVRQLEPIDISRGNVSEDSDEDPFS